MVKWFNPPALLGAQTERRRSPWQGYFDPFARLYLRFGSDQTFAARWIEVKGHPSGFDYMRVALATSVLLWHSYQISYGTPAALDVWRTPAGFMLEAILPMFFALSGFLVSGSLERSRNLRTFLTLRIIKIYPALCVEVFASAFILGPIVTTSRLSQYFTGRQFFSYLANTIGWIHYPLPGVFLNNPLSDVVNTSLWTVPFELECYIVLPILVWFGFMRSRQATLFIFAACTILVVVLLARSGESGTPPGGVHGRVLVLCFLAGALVYRFRDVFPYSGRLSLVAAVLATIMLRYNSTVFFAPVFVAYITAYLGMQNPRRTILINSGDYSYGLYLYAAPIQQTVAWTFGASNNWALNVFVALPATALLALVSWHVVEKPFSKVKKYVLPT